MITVEQFRSLSIERQKEEIINILRETPTLDRETFNVKDGYCCGSWYVRKLFGSWSKAKEAAGIVNNGSSTEKRAFAKRIIDENGCWIWTGAHDINGYGAINHEGQQWRIHRWSYMFYVGYIPDDYEIDHLCGVKSCFNPNHLQLIHYKDHTSIETKRGKIIVNNRRSIIRPSNISTLEECHNFYLENACFLNEYGCLTTSKLAIRAEGYYRFSFKNSVYYLHRSICSLNHGLDYEDKTWEASHICKDFGADKDISKCLCEKHIVPMSKEEHMKRQARFENNKNTVINKDIAIEIKKLLLQPNNYATLKERNEYIASKFNIKRNIVEDISRGRSWNDIFPIDL